MLVAWILSLIILSVQAQADELTTSSQIMTDEGCLSETLINDIRSEFKFIVASELQNFRLEACDSKHVTNRLFRGLAFLKYGRFNASNKSSDEIFFNSFATVSPYEFFRSRIKKIEFRVCDRPGSLAYSSRGWDMFVVCVDGFEKEKKDGNDLPAYFFAAASVHESRHTDTDDVGHFDCIQGQNKGLPKGCDRDRAQHGAYHFYTDYLIYLSQFGNNFHPAIQQSARARAILSLLNKFNTVPKVKNSKYLLTRDYHEERLLYFFGDKPLRDAGSFPPEKIFSRPEGNVLGYDPVTKVFSGWTLFEGASEPLSGYATEYNKETNVRETVTDYIGASPPESLVSSMIVGQTLKYSIYNMNSQMIVDDSVVLPFHEAQRFLKPAFCNGAKDHVYILTKDQIVYEGALDKNNRIQFKEINNCETGLLNMVFWNNRSLALSTDGQLLELKGKTWTPVANTIGKIFDFLSEPFDIYDFFIPKQK